MYQVRFTPKGLEQIEQLSKPVAQQVLKKLRWMAENFDQSTHVPLTGNLKGVFKLRVGDYRALYTFDQESQTIMIHFVQHRSEVYKDK
jgi:mRNA interferase RelE/StbE